MDKWKPVSYLGREQNNWLRMTVGTGTAKETTAMGVQPTFLSSLDVIAGASSQGKVNLPIKRNIISHSSFVTERIALSAKHSQKTARPTDARLKNKIFIL